MCVSNKLFKKERVFKQLSNEKETYLVTFKTEFLADQCLL